MFELNEMLVLHLAKITRRGDRYLFLVKTGSRHRLTTKNALESKEIDQNINFIAIMILILVRKNNHNRHFFLICMYFLTLVINDYPLINHLLQILQASRQ